MSAMSTPAIRIRGLSKTFTLHQQGGTVLKVLDQFDLDVQAGECVVLSGPSGAGKSTVLKCIHANYLASSGSIELQHDGQTVNMVSAPAQLQIDIRRRTLAYVSQFLRVIPRVPALDIVAEPLLNQAAEDGEPADDGEQQRAARTTAGQLLSLLHIPASLWNLPPATFSGGEQQRINIARSLIDAKPVLLLDEPTASLDAANRQTVIFMIRRAREAGAAIVGIFHDQEVRDAVATRMVEMKGNI